MTKADDKVIDEAKDNFRRCREWESATRARYLDDIRFGNADSTNLWQWPEQVSRSRMMSDKPCMTINKSRVYCLQIVNDARQHKPQVRINAVGNGATYKAAQVFEGVIRHIENISNAQEAYDAATWHQVFGGFGYWRITTDYLHDDTFDQGIFIKRCPNPLNVYLDPAIQEFDGSDARFGFIFSDWDKADFEKEYPKHKDAVGEATLNNTEDQSWFSEKQIRVAEYFRRVDSSDTLHYMPDGTTLHESQISDTDIRQQVRDAAQRSRDVSKTKVEWYLIAGNTVIEKREWLGRYIPIVRVIGEETVINKQLDRRGHVRALTDAQRAYNYYTSAAIEFVALQSKTPWIAPVQAIEGYEEDWAKANTVNLAVLPYNHLNDDGREIPKPEREQPPVFAPAYLEGVKLAQNEMMMASGQFEAVMGEESNERSGKAINERQRAAANSTYHFVDHLAQAIRFTGKILVDLIPKVYDTPRIIKILGEDGTQSTIQLDPNHPQAHTDVPAADPESIDPQQIAMIFNPQIGEFAVETDIGPAFATKRQEAFSALSDILAQNESLAPLIGDLWAKMGDFPLADEISQRLRNMLPPQATGQVNPQVQQLQQLLAQQHGVMQQMQQEIAQAKSKAMSTDLQKEVDWYKAETDRLKAVGGIDPQALMPIVRELVSQVLGSPVNHYIDAHMIEGAQMAARAQQSAPQQPPSQPQG